MSTGFCVLGRTAGCEVEERDQKPCLSLSVYLFHLLHFLMASGVMCLRYTQEYVEPEDDGQLWPEACGQCKEVAPHCRCSTPLYHKPAMGDTDHKTPRPKLTLQEAELANNMHATQDPAASASCTLQVQMHNSGKGGPFPAALALKWKRGGSFRFCIICGRDEKPPALELAHGFVNFCRWRDANAPGQTWSRCPCMSTSRPAAIQMRCIFFSRFR